MPKNEFAINNKLNKVKKTNPIQHIVFRNNPYLFFIGTNLLFIVSIAIQANKGAVRKLPVIAANTKSFTPTPPDLAISKDMQNHPYLKSISLSLGIHVSKISTPQ